MPIEIGNYSPHIAETYFQQLSFSLFLFHAIVNRSIELMLVWILVSIFDTINYSRYFISLRQLSWLPTACFTIYKNFWRFLAIAVPLKAYGRKAPWVMNRIFSFSID